MKQLVLISIIVMIFIAPFSINAIQMNTQIEIHSSAAKILQSRGYIAKDHHVRVQEGKYTLNLIQAKNPLINYADHQDKEPLLFIHGILNNANAFILLNEGVKPKNYSSYKLGSISEIKLQDLLKNDPASQSLVFATLNFGYEVWLLNCRSTSDTRAIQNTATFHDIDSSTHEDDDDNDGDATNVIYSGKLLIGKENSYWNYSLDEQALYDLPESIDYILEQSQRRKLSLVAHSCGTTRILMALSEIPELADKISKAILWAPIMDFEYGALPGLIDTIFSILSPTLSNLKAPLLPPKLVYFMENLMFTICRYGILKRLVCEPFFDPMGEGTSQLKLLQLLKQNWLETIGNFEIVHFYQDVWRKRMHRYDYKNLPDNLKAYGQLKPPAYNVSRIRLKSISLWFGITDEISRIENFNSFSRRVTVPVEQHIVGDSENLFNHMGFQLHERITNLLIIPCLKKLAENN